MRTLALTILTMGIVLAAGQARAQTYDPAFPVCMHVVPWEAALIMIAPTIRWPNARRRLPARSAVRPQPILRGCDGVVETKRSALSSSRINIARAR